MDTYTEIGSYEAKSHFPEVLRKARAGEAFRITNRGEHVADLLPPGVMEARGAVEAARRMQRFAARPANTGAAPVSVDIRALIEEGRD